MPIAEFPVNFILSIHKQNVLITKLTNRILFNITKPKLNSLIKVAFVAFYSSTLNCSKTFDSNLFHVSKFIQKT